MASDYKILGQSNPSAATLTTAYTVPASTQTVISRIIVANRSATPTTFRIALRPAGAAISNEHYIAYDAAIGANEFLSIPGGVTLDTTDVVSVYATLATLSFNILGDEIT